MLKGKVAVITGAGSGIGRATALRLAKEGAAIVVADINEESAKATAKDVEKLGVDALSVQVDVKRIPQIQAMVDAAVEKYGRIDILVSCAGVIQIKRMLDITEADWDRLFDINCKGLFFTGQLVAKQMQKQRSGVIVNLSSISARGPRAMQLHYAATKAAVISITWSMAAGLAPDGIRVNAICPGIVETPMWDQIDHEMADQFGVPEGGWRKHKLSLIPLGRLQTPEDVANAVAFLVSPEAGYITGQAINVDGGFQMN